MLEQMARLLYEVGVSKIEAFEDEFEKQTTSIHAYLNNLFEYFKKKGIHILVAIDDVCKTNGMVDFIRAYQGLLIDHYDVRLLMGGSYNDIVELEKEPSISFLFRASKIQLSPLSIQAIAISYQTSFDISETEALKLTKTTKGYALAYQILGDILFKSDEKSINQKILSEFNL